MPYEYLILCRRPAPTPPTGWPYREHGMAFHDLPESLWRSMGVLLSTPDGRVDLAPRGVQALSLRCDDSGDVRRFTALARVLTNASEGYLLEAMPVTAPPIHWLRHKGTHEQLDWAGVMQASTETLSSME